MIVNGLPTKASGLALGLAAMALVVAGGPTAAPAKGGDVKSDRTEFYGIVEDRPEGSLQGLWVIGGRTVTADDRTQFDQSEGVLAVGACAKVALRGGRVHEIESEPPHDCQ